MCLISSFIQCDTYYLVLDMARWSTYWLFCVPLFINCLSFSYYFSIFNDKLLSIDTPEPVNFIRYFSMRALEGVISNVWLVCLMLESSYTLSAAYWLLGYMLFYVSSIWLSFGSSNSVQSLIFLLLLVIWCSFFLFLQGMISLSLLGLLMSLRLSICLL